ncbi:helix-turn-helix domain-containing protein [Nocardioides sp.]|uniref:helix-turn-helix domain-containing protein n=1 Tax=Nocardioides sp. TaxID=35761 RepID=UPI002B269F8C|nr:GAF domain-containing protein [Nocardioides sp.]
MPLPTSFLDLLYAGASEEALDAALRERELLAPDDDARADLRHQHGVALRLRERMSEQRRREAELGALYETAHDLIAIRDVDAILTAIVRRARRLLQADMTYLSLNDEAEGASYMRVTDGSVSAQFRTLRLPLGTGLLGLVAQTGAPYYTDDYKHDQRFEHQEYIDHAVNDEDIRAILGVPLIVEGKVIGALLAGHRAVRPFPASEVTLLTSFAAHAAVALENARLFTATQQALAEVDDTNRQMREQSRAVEIGAQAHDRLTEVILQGGGLDQVVQVLAEVLGGDVWIQDAAGVALASSSSASASTSAVDLDADLGESLGESLATGRSVEVGAGLYVVASLAGSEHLGTLVLRPAAGFLDMAGRRTLERGALVTALILLFNRSVSAAEDRVRGELLTDLLSGREGDPGWVRERVRRHRLDLDRLRVVAVADVHGADPHRAALVAARLGDDLRGLGGEHEGHIVLLADAQVPLAIGRQLHHALRQAGGPVTVGVSLVEAAAPADLSTAWQRARSCVLTLQTLGRAGEVSDAAGLGLARLVLGDNGPAELDAYLTQTLGPLVAYDAERGTDLMGTLEAWFAASGRTARTAEALHVHHNTVGQRLDRIGALLGDGWREPGPALEQQLALRLWRLARGVGGR